jgi:3-oxoadipate enol-lactonase
MPDFTHKGRRLHYEILGAGTPIVLVHGFTNVGLSWMHQIAALVFNGYQVILPDLYGHGLSQSATETTTVDMLTSDVVALLDHLEVERATICGLSLGGMIAQVAALDYPDRVDRVVIANSRASFADPSLADVVAGWIALFEQPDGPLKRFRATWPLMLNEAFRSGSAGQATFETWSCLASRASGNSFVNIALGMRSFDVQDRLGRIGHQTLVICGDQDSLFPPMFSRQMSEAIPGARLVVIPGASHISCLDSADEFNRRLIDFLSSTSDSSRPA